MSTVLKPIVFALLVMGAIIAGPAAAQSDLVEQGYTALSRGDPDRATSLGQRALAAAQDDQARFAALSLLADVAFDHDAPDDALILSQQADALATALYGKVHEARLYTLDRIAILQNDLGQRAGAVRAFAELLRIGRAVEADEADRLFDTLNAAGVFLEMQAPRDASVLASDALWMAEDLEGQFSETYATAAFTRAQAQLALGHPVEGLVTLWPVLDAGLDSYLTEWPDLGPQLETLFALYDQAAAAQGDIGAVQDDWLKQAADIRATRAPFPWDQIEQAFVPAFASGQLDLADQIARRLFSGLPADDPRPAQIYLVLAQAHLGRGDPASAHPWVTRMFLYPPGFLAAFLDRPADLTDPVADFLETWGRASEALRLTETALAVTHIAYDDSAGVTQAQRLAFAGRLAVAGQTDAARAEIEKVQAAQAGQTDPVPYLRAWTLFELGQQALETGQLDTARDHINAAIVTVDTAGLPPDPLVIDMLRTAAEAEARAKAPAAAVILADRAVAAAQSHYGQGARQVFPVQLTLLNALFADGQDRRARALLAELQNHAARRFPPDDPLRQTLVLVALQNADQATLGASADNLLAPLLPGAEAPNIPAGLRAALLTTAAQITYDAGQSDLADKLLSQVWALVDPPPEAAQILRARQLLDSGQIDPALSLFDLVSKTAFDPGRPPPTHLPFHLEALQRKLNTLTPEQQGPLLEQAFVLTQRINTTKAGQALGQAAARWQVGGALADLVRAQQDNSTRAAALRDQIGTALAQGAEVSELRASLQATVTQQAALGADIARDHSGFAAFGIAEPVSLQRVQAVLAPDEALLVIASTDLTTAQGESVSQITLVRRDRVVATSLPARADLARLAEALRCQAALTDPRCAIAAAGATRGGFVLDPEPEAEGTAFDYDLAHLAFQLVLGDLSGDLTGVSRLVFVPDTATVALPFHLMLTANTDSATGFAQAPWLIRDFAVSVAPSVASFHTLRQQPTRPERSARFLGVGDPLIGHQASGAVAYPCGQAQDVLVAALDNGQVAYRAAQGGLALRDLSALPETRCELAEIAGLFGDNHSLLLQDQARESRIKALSASGELTRYSVLSFATHGLIAGEIGNAEAGLVLTPPDQAGPEDDGLLSTHEIAALRLDADFVILSACNTAAGNGGEDEALSGLASAFFYAGARSLLVSHWPVYSEAAVVLTTRMLQAWSTDPGLSRSQAMQAAVLSALDDPFADDQSLNPAYWAPFMVVGAD